MFKKMATENQTEIKFFNDRTGIIILVISLATTKIY